MPLSAVLLAALLLLALGIGTVSALGGETVAGGSAALNDASGYISIETLTNGQDADTPPGPFVAAGSPVTWTYVVTNTGPLTLTQVQITDSQGVIVTAPASAINPGESMTATAVGTAQDGQYATVGTVTGLLMEGPQETASDPSHYFGVAPPVADFTANATDGPAPLAVQFADASTGDGIAAWSWEFGDGGTSTEQHPVHVFTAPGTYTVNLTVTNAGGSDGETKPGHVTVLQDAPPVGGNTAYFLVTTDPAGAEVYLEARDGTRFQKGDTGAGPLNITLYLTAVPMGRIVAVLPGYLEAAREIASYPAAGETVPVHLVLASGTGGPFPAPHVPSTVIQAEDYDSGGEGAAYHDLEPANLGGAYRPAEGVDVETVNGVTNVGWIRSGEYLKYTVDTTIAGRFTLVLRAANPDPVQKQVAVHLDGAPVTEVLVGSTGSWTTYAEYGGVEPLYLGAGRHTLTLDFAGVDRVNLDWLRLAAGTVPAGGGKPYPSVHAVPGRVEAEDYDVGGFSDTTPANEGGAYRTDAVDIERGGSGYNVGWIRAGEYLQYSVDAAAAGTYAVSFRVANPGGPKGVTVLVNGGAHLLTVPATGSFGAWQTATLSGVPLSAGRNTVRVETGRASSFNLDYLEFSTGPVVTTTTPGQAGGASFTAAPLSSRAGAAVKFAVTPAAGKTIRSAWWSFDAPAHLSTWNSRAINPTFFYPRTGTFSPLVKLTYTDGSTETVHRADYVRAT